MGVDVIGMYGGRLVTKSNTASQSLTGVTFSVPAGGVSSWTAVFAPTAADTVITGAGFYNNAGTSLPDQNVFQLEIGYGASGSETVLTTMLFTGASVADLPVLQRVAAGQRVAVRGTQVTSWGGPVTVAVYLATVPVSALENS